MKRACQLRPPHSVRDAAKLAAMVETLRTGGSLPPVVANGDVAFCGSHRIAADDHARLAYRRGEDGWDNEPNPVEVVDLSDEDYAAMCEQMGVDLGDHESSGDFNSIAKIISDTTTDDAVRAALVDQWEE